MSPFKGVVHFVWILHQFIKKKKKSYKVSLNLGEHQKWALGLWPGEVDGPAPRCREALLARPRRPTECCLNVDQLGSFSLEALGSANMCFSPLRFTGGMVTHGVSNRRLSLEYFFYSHCLKKTCASQNQNSMGKCGLVSGFSRMYLATLALEIILFPLLANASSVAPPAKPKASFSKHS